MNNIIEFVKKELAFDHSGHNFKHIERVVKNAKYLIKHEGGNEKIIITSCYLHDIIDSKLFDDIDLQKEKIVDLLVNNHYLPSEIEEILEVIDRISFSKGNIDECYNLNIEIVRDADRLDAIGAIGIIRAIEYGTSKQRQFYEEANLEYNESNISFKESTNTSLSHFYDKLLKLKDYMHTYTAKKMAEKRHEFMLKFLEEFYSEIK
ncbi:MAG: HD domain-containing protein [Bacilli bacterium]|nr:HD domain-containing protein [Bacilli bacterium]